MKKWLPRLAISLCIIALLAACGGQKQLQPPQWNGLSDEANAATADAAIETASAALATANALPTEQQAPPVATAQVSVATARAAVTQMGLPRPWSWKSDGKAVAISCPKGQGIISLKDSLKNEYSSFKT